MSRSQRSASFSLAGPFLAACVVAHPIAARTAELPQARVDFPSPRGEIPPTQHNETSPEAKTTSDPASPNGFPEIRSQPFFRTVPKGESRTIAFFSALFPDCSSQGPVVARLTSQPQHGSVTFEEGDSFPRYVPTSSLASCNPKKVPGLKMIYTTQENYEGADAYNVLLINPDGTAFGLDVKLMIR